MGSSLYLEISDQELERLVSETLSARLISARILTGGLFNTTYLLDICQKPGDISGQEGGDGGGAQRVVLRLGPVNRHLLMPFEHRLMEAETEVYALCETNGIPASQVLAVDTSKKLIDRDFMFVRYILPGRSVNFPWSRMRWLRSAGKSEKPRQNFTPSGRPGLAESWMSGREKALTPGAKR